VPCGQAQFDNDCAARGGDAGRLPSVATRHWRLTRHTRMADRSKLRLNASIYKCEDGGLSCIAGSRTLATFWWLIRFGRRNSAGLGDDSAGMAAGGCERRSMTCESHAAIATSPIMRTRLDRAIASWLVMYSSSQKCRLQVYPVGVQESSERSARPSLPPANAAKRPARSLHRRASEPFFFFPFLRLYTNAFVAAVFLVKRPLRGIGARGTGPHETISSAGAYFNPHRPSRRGTSPTYPRRPRCST